MKGCVLTFAGGCDYGDWNGPQLHHVLPKQRIRRDYRGERPIAEVLDDSRNLVPLCHRHHHRITHGWDRPLLASHLLDRIVELSTFAEEIGMTAGLRREIRLYGVVSLFDDETPERPPREEVEARLREEADRYDADLRALARDDESVE